MIEQLLITGKANVHSVDNYGQTPLSLAAANGQTSVFKLLLEAKADVNSKDWFDLTPNQCAARSGQRAATQMLLDTSGTIIDSQDKYRRTPLSWAAANSHDDVVKLLLEAGADIKSSDTTFVGCQAEA